MKKGILFIVALVLVAASIIIQINAGSKAHTWTVILPLLFIPAATYIALKVNFKTDDNSKD